MNAIGCRLSAVGMLFVLTAAPHGIVGARTSGPDAIRRHDDRQSSDASGSVTCRVPEDPDARVYVLHGPRLPAGMRGAGGEEPSRPLYDGWQIAMQSGQTSGRWIRLALPGARPEITATTARLSYRNANGGRQVELTVQPDGASLDLWVDHGLEVNIEPDLDPRVDLLNTEGRLALSCTIAPGPTEQ
jgi:hypothetical protein